jgi:hypothetical protein
MKQLTRLSIIAALSLNGATLSSGLHMFVADSNETLSVGDYSGKADVIYAINDSKTGYKSFLPTNTLSFLNSLQSLEANKGYLVKISNDNTDFTNYKSLSSINETDIILYKGLNIVALPAMTSIPLGMYYLNGAKIEVIYSINDSKTGYKSYLPSNTLSFLNSLQTIESDKVYLVKVTGEINDIYITSALKADTNLGTIDSAVDDLANKSLLIMSNNSGALKTELITFDANSTYRAVEVPNFSASTLTGTSSDINTSVNSLKSTSGVCGYNWNLASTNVVNMTETQGGSTVQATYNPTDGNLTIGSTYHKVVWYSTTPVDLSAITCTTTSGVLFPPQIP